MYSGERFAIPVPRAWAEEAISSVIMFAYFVSADVATRTIICDCSNFAKLNDE